jgi:hypothetical protein
LTEVITKVSIIVMFLYSPQLKYIYIYIYCYDTCNYGHLILKASFIIFPSHLLKLF